MDHDLVYFLPSGLGFNVANGNTPPAEEQREGARAFLEKRPPHFAKFRRRRT